jgi:hypothetical protein
MTRVLALGLAILFGAGCGPDPSTARGTAEAFLDAYYVTINLKKALPYTAGLAREKVQQSIDLTSGQPIDGSTNTPNVHYELIEERPQGEGTVSFAYLGTIRSDGGDATNRRWLLTVRRDGDAWRVMNFQEETPS